MSVLDDVRESDPVGHAESGHPTTRMTTPIPMGRTTRLMQQCLEHRSASEELADVATLDAKFTERTRRLSALMDLDRMLSQAANRYSLAADLVRGNYECAERAD